MAYKNCYKNDEKVIKLNAQENFEDALALNLKHNKISQQRMNELIEKIIKVKSNDQQAYVGTESGIKVIAQGADDMIVDLVVHYIVSNESEPDKMIVKYAAAYSRIKNASEQQFEASCKILQTIITNALKPFKFEDGDEEKATISAQLFENGKNELTQRLLE